MASLRTLVSPNRRAAARLVGQTRRRLQKALAERPHVKRSKIAEALGVHRSVITRNLNGTQDMTIGRAGELAWALGYEAEFILKAMDAGPRRNDQMDFCPAFEKVVVQPKQANPQTTIRAIEYEWA